MPLKKLKIVGPGSASFNCINITFDTDEPIIFIGEFAEGEFCINGFKWQLISCPLCYLRNAKLTENIEYYADDVSIINTETNADILG